MAISKLVEKFTEGMSFPWPPSPCMCMGSSDCSTPWYHLDLHMILLFRFGIWEWFKWKNVNWDLWECHKSFKSSLVFTGSGWDSQKGAAYLLSLPKRPINVQTRSLPWKMVVSGCAAATSSSCLLKKALLCLSWCWSLCLCTGETCCLQNALPHRSGKWGKKV